MCSTEFSSYILEALDDLNVSILSVDRTSHNYETIIKVIAPSKAITSLYDKHKDICTAYRIAPKF